MSTEKLESFEKIGERIREARKTAGLRQRQLAARVGCSAANISSIERGEWGPSDSLLLNLCRELRLSREWLTQGQSTPYTEAVQSQALAWNEPPEMYTNDPKRIELLIKVKRLIMVADDHTVGALSMNVDEFMRRYEVEKKKTEDGD